MPKNHATAKAVFEAANPSRRRRYARFPTEALCISLTPVRLDILRFLADLRFLSLPQIARLCCPSARQDLAEKSARRQMRMLFDASLVDVLPVSRAALAPAHSSNDAFLLYGSAPNVYAPTALGLETLFRAGLVDKPDAVRKKPAYGPKNSLFLAHELAVRDVRVWLELAVREFGYELEQWRDGEAAAINLDRDQPPFMVRPDAWFVLRLGRTVLVGLVEVDRGTERGDRRWRQKLDAYEALFVGGCLLRVTGYVNARTLVITPDARRRDQIARFITDAPKSITPRFWIAEHSVLSRAHLTLPEWRQEIQLPLRALVSADSVS